MSLLGSRVALGERCLRAARRSMKYGVLSAAGVTLLYGCGTSGAATVARANNLTVQFAGPPISLNPALGGNGGSSVFTSLDYDPLIYLTGSGKLIPDLATSWKYVGSGHKTFEMTLRSGVKFTDGNTLTAQDAVNSMNYFLKAGGGLVGGVGDIASISAPSSNTIKVVYKTANPDAAGTMDQYNGIGQIIGPKGLASPKSLLTTSDGTGPYTYDATTSVANSQYNYTRNPNYFAPSTQKFDEVSIKIIGDPNSVLSAAETGQVEFAGGSPTTAAQAKGAGLTVLSEPFFNWSLIVPATGAVQPALANLKVREAIAYAFNRAQLATALGGSYAKASTEALVPGADGYVKGGGWSYDLKKAKQLLASAGYPKGFSMSVLTESLIDPNTTYSQAFVQALAAIGIKTKLTVISTGIGQFSAAAQSKKYAAVIFPSAGDDMYQLAQQVLPPGIFNPFALPTPSSLQSLLNKAYAASGAQQTSLYQQANTALTKMATLIPIIATETPNYVSSKLGNVVESVANPNPVPEAPDAAYAWYQK